MDLKRPSYQRAVWWTMQGLTESFSEKKKHCLALEYIKTVDLDYCSSLGCSAGQILIQKFTKFDQQRETVPTR